VTTVATATGSTLSRRELVVAFSAIMLATLLAALDQTIVATALPSIVTDLRGFEDLSWVVTAYLVTSTVTVPLYGKLSDLYGRRPLFVVSISIFVLGSILCGLAQSMGQLIAFRALQGIGAGGLLPLAQASIADLFPPRERGRYQGFVGAVWATAAVAGPLLGGTLTDAATWRWIFWINIPLGLIALIVVVRTMRAPSTRREHVIDFLGALLLSAAILGVLLISVWPAAAVLAAVALPAFIAVERRAPDPILPLSLFANRVFAVTVSGAFVIGALLFVVTIYVPVFVQGVLGASATGSGVVLIPLSLGWTTISVVAGQVIARTGRYRLFPVFGGVLIVSGMWLLSELDTASSPGDAAAALVVLGIGMGVTHPIYVIATQNAVDVSDLGVATSSLLFLRTMGGSLAVAGLGVLLTHRLDAELSAHLGAAASRVDPDRLLQGGAVAHELQSGTDAALAAALHTVFVVSLPLAVVALALALALPNRPLRGTTS
jgi:EmrB/QacA subfamily drug resistance transporter